MAITWWGLLPPPHLHTISYIMLNWHVLALSTKPGALTLLESSTLEISSGFLLWAVGRSPHLSALRGTVRHLMGERRKRLQNGTIPISQSSELNTYRWSLLSTWDNRLTAEEAWAKQTLQSLLPPCFVWKPGTDSACLLCIHDIARTSPR